MPGVYEITDENGTVVGTVGTDTNGNPIVSKDGGGTVTITDDGLETDSVSTEVLENIADIIIQSDDDPQTRINEASAYDTVVAHPGQQTTLSSPLEVTTDGLTVRGLNLRTGDGMNDVALWVHACQDVTVSGCRVDGNKANQTIASADGIANGIEVSDASNVRIENNEVFDVNGQGIAANARTRDSGKPNGAVSEVRIVGNEVRGIENGDILLMGGEGLDANNGWVVDNYCESSEQDILNVGDGWQQAVVRGNHVEGGAVCLALEQHPGRGVVRPLRGVVVHGNTFKNKTSNVNGVEIQYAAQPYEDITISGNTLLGNGTSGPQAIRFDTVNQDVSEVKISDNTFRSWQRGTEMVDGVRDISISDNTFADVGRAISVEDSQDTIIADNDIRNATGGTVGAIAVFADTEDMNGVKILGNHVEVTTEKAISLFENAGTIDYWIIKNNTITGSGGGIDTSDTTGTNGITADNQTY